MIPSVQIAQQRLQEILGLTPALAARAVAETLDTMQLDVDEYITARHAELHDRGIGNAEIFMCIEAELSALRFPAKRLTARQIRRRVYG